MTEPMTVTEVAQYMRVSNAQVARLCNADGGIPHLRVGLGKRAKIIVDKPDLDAWIERNKRNNNP